MEADGGVFTFNVLRRRWRYQRHLVVNLKQDVRFFACELIMETMDEFNLSNNQYCLTDRNADF